MFIKGLALHNKQWKLISDLIKTRTVVQVRTHAQKYFQKLIKQGKSQGKSDDSLLSEDYVFDVKGSSLEVSSCYSRLYIIPRIFKEESVLMSGLEVRFS
jgi:hypothetical protein